MSLDDESKFHHLFSVYLLKIDTIGYQWVYLKDERLYVTKQKRSVFNHGYAVHLSLSQPPLG